ncbi:MAG: hypothetical protein WBQ18_06340, partial [Solirubrobacteraceae bacterium]
SSPPPRSPAEPSVWPARLSTAAESVYRWVMQPRVRLTLAGIVVLIIGAVLMTGSVWTLPLVIVGALMVVVACIGHRLEGRFIVEFGDTGAEIGFRASVKPAASPQTTAVTGASRKLLSTEQAHPSAPGTQPLAPLGDDVIEGEAHTVEIDVAELKALIAAAESAESAESAGATPDAGDDSWREVNVHRLSSTPASASASAPVPPATDLPRRENHGG